MTKSNTLGEFEIIVLATLMRLGEEAYGNRISTDIEGRIGRMVSVGAIYTTLTRLEAKGCVTSKLGEATAERGGRAKRYFRITAQGDALLRQSAEAFGQVFDGIITWP